VTGCERILARLEQGPATAAELYALGVMVHSRVADLRKRGHTIVCEHIAGKTGTEGFEYRLLNRGGKAEGTAAPASIEQPVPASRAGCSTSPSVVEAHPAAVPSHSGPAETDGNQLGGAEGVQLTIEEAA
jgi:hypothetical protein